MTISEKQHDVDILLKKIKIKRQELAEYLARNESRHARLVNSSIIFGALTAALTVGPGVGGSKFIDAAKGVVSLGIPVWQFLCLLAAVLSVAAVIANGMLKSQNLTFKIASARNCSSKLEGLEALLELRQMGVKQAASLYTQYISEIQHV